MFLVPLLVLQQGPSIRVLDQLAQSRNVAVLTKYLSSDPAGGRSPFNLLRTNGAYEVGRFGWHALPLKGVDGQEYVIFSTPLTSEDTGELVFKRDGQTLEFVPESESFGVKLVRHSFDLRFDVPSKKAILVDRLRLSGNPSRPAFLFRMSPQYIVSSIKDKDGRPVPFLEAGGVVSTKMPAGVDVYAISYSASVDQPNYAGSIGPKEATLTNDYWYPMVARQPTPYDLVVHTQPSWIAIGQGDLVVDKTVGQERTFQYRMDLPCVFYSVSAGPFKKVTAEIHGKIYSCWSSTMTTRQMQAQAELYAPIIEFYSRFMPFPFKGYGAIDSEVYGGGALEAYSFTTWGHGSLPMEDAHEPSHTWWGGIVNNTYLGSFWNESFAVFSDGLYHRNAEIGSVAERRQAFIQSGEGNDSYNQVAIAKSGADVGGIGSSLGYGKGGQVLQMLEQLLGTDKMIQTMQEWIRKCHGTASDWSEYESVVAQLNPDRDIKSFFDDWIRKPGYADLKVSDVHFADGRVRMKVAFGGASYRIPLEVMLQFADGSRVFKTIDLKSPGYVEIACDRKPDILSVDPWRRILRRIEPDEQPVELSRFVAQYSRYSDPSHTDYLTNVGGKGVQAPPPDDPAGTFLVGNPATMPTLNKLCRAAGFTVNGSQLTYDGTTIDLNDGCAMAVVDLGGGKTCVIGMGKTRVAPDFGRARLVLTDGLGHFLRGKTEPKTSGYLTFRL
ncbi:MAG: M1 family aminopeptidase [Fimbriimonas sp.]|nr:M1 family aminopeptidase [Fimbriimonas sp.]